MLVASKVSTFTTAYDTGLLRIPIGGLINVNDWIGTGDKLFQLDNLVGVTRYTTILQGFTNGNLKEISGTGGGTPIAVYDEGVVVNTAICGLNFIGADVVAQQDGTNPCLVNVYIPPPSFPSHFNTVDGITNGNITDSATTLRRIATPGLYQTGSYLTNNTNTYPCTNVVTIVYFNTADVLLDDLNTTMKAEILGADGVTVAATHTVGPITGNFNLTQNNINITMTNFAPNSSKYVGRFAFTFSINAVFPNSGKITLRMTHNSGTGVYVKTQTFFYDSTNLTATMDTPLLFSEVTPVFKYLSGVKYYHLNSAFNVTANNIDYLNTDSYPATHQLYFSAPTLGLPALSVMNTDANLIGYTNSWNDDNDVYSNSNWRITTANLRYIGNSAQVSGYTIDWANGPTIYSTAKGMLIDTWVDQSTVLAEYFTDEAYRRKSDYTAWDSTQSLITYDDLYGAQVIGGMLKVPRILSATNGNNANFSLWEPAGNPNYSTMDGRTYYREFTDVTSQVRGSAFMAISGFTLTHLVNGEVEMYIDVPGRFVSECFVHGAALYNFGTFDADNDPCRLADSTASNIHFSFGTWGLDATHNKFRMRLVINNPAIEINSIVVSW